MSVFIYALCAITAFGCAFFLLRGYQQRNKSRLLLWSGLCFICLFFNNLMLVVDRILLPQIDLSLERIIPALIGMTVLLYGLIWEGD